jgi:hypothetical protein
MAVEHPDSSGLPGPEDVGSDLSIVQFNLTHEGFGLVLDFLSNWPPFADYDLKTMAEAIRRQLHHGYHLVALRGTVIIGYAGWLLTTTEIGEAWLAGRGKLVAAPKERANAAALTTVAARERTAVRLLIRGARDRNPGKRIFFKRDGATGVRKTTVMNIVPGAD